MPAAITGGGEKYWFNGLPFEGVRLIEEGEETHWFDGLPLEFVYGWDAPEPSDISPPDEIPTPGIGNIFVNAIFLGTNF